MPVSNLLIASLPSFNIGMRSFPAPRISVIASAVLFAPSGIFASRSEISSITAEGSRRLPAESTTWIPIALNARAALPAFSSMSSISCASTFFGSFAFMAATASFTPSLIAATISRVCSLRISTCAAD